MLTASPGVDPGDIARGAPLQAAVRRAPAASFLAAVLAFLGAAWLAGASGAAAIGALVTVYAGGFVVGALLVAPAETRRTLAWYGIRTVAGLLLTTIAFLLSLLLSLPWFALPAALVAVAVSVEGRHALVWPQTRVQMRWDDIGAGVVSLILVSPILISAFAMAPGDYPPAFYNVDTAYFMEKVHALVAATSYPPESLSNLGGLRTYHFGTHAMAALVSRVSGLLAHHALFLVVLPLLVAGLLAAAFTAARFVSPALPRSLAVPLLLISVPSLRSSFWSSVGPQLWANVTAGAFSLDEIILRPYERWGVLSNQAQNVGGDFLVLGSIAAMAAAPSSGWRLPVFLIGSAILVKTPVGVALLAGFALAEAWRAFHAGRLRPSPQMLGVTAVFVTTYVAFWVAPAVTPDFGLELYPFYHLNLYVTRAGVAGVIADILWLLLPALIVAGARIRTLDGRSAALLAMAFGPLLVANATRMIDVRAYEAGTDDDWIQLVRPVTPLIHAWVLLLADSRWRVIGRWRRHAFVIAIVLAIAAPAAAAARYSFLFLRNPASGHEYADNRPLAAALSVIPTSGSVVVTNDLRYPAERFRREDRQMQIPALFGHQAFAVNSVYEAYRFTAERRELQKLLQRPDWTDDIRDAARAHGWTHLLIRKDYVHPAPIPLEPVFQNEWYAVFRF